MALARPVPQTGTPNHKRAALQQRIHSSTTVLALPSHHCTAEDIDVENFEDFLVLFRIHAINLLAIFSFIFIPDLHSFFFSFLTLPTR